MQFFLKSLFKLNLTVLLLLLSIKILSDPNEKKSEKSYIPPSLKLSNKSNHTKIRNTQWNSNFKVDENYIDDRDVASSESDQDEFIESEFNSSSPNRGPSSTLIKKQNHPEKWEYPKKLEGNSEEKKKIPN